MIEIECGSEEIEARDDRVVCEREIEAKDDRIVRERAAVPRLRYHHARDRQWQTTSPPSSHDPGTHTDTSDVRDVKNCEDQNLRANVEDIFCAEDDQLEDRRHVSFENGAPAEWADDKRDNYSIIINVNASGHDAIYGNHDVGVRSHDITDGSHNDDVIDGIHDTAGRSHNDYVIAGNHDETNRSHDATDKSHDTTDKSHDATDKSHDATDKSHDAAYKSHDTTDKSHDATDKSHDTTDKSHDATDKSHDATDKSHDATDKSHDYTSVGDHSTSVGHDITDGSHPTNLDTDGHIIKVSSVPDNTCVKQGECNLGASTEHILQSSTCAHKLPMSTQAANVTDRNRGNIQNEADISSKRKVSILVDTSSKGHIRSAVKTLGHVAAIRGIPSEVIAPHCSHVGDTIAICHKDMLDHQVEEDNCFDTNSGCIESVTNVVDTSSLTGTLTGDITVDLVTPGEGDALVSEMISGSDGVYEQEARRDVDSSEPSCGDDGSVIQRTQQCVTTQDSSTCETKQDKPEALVCFETEHGVGTDDVVDVVNRSGGLSDPSATTSDSGSHVNHVLRENPVLLERKGTTRTPDGATVQTNKHHSKSSGRDSVAPDASYLLSTPDTIDLSPSSGEDMSSPNFVASVQKQLLQMQACQNLLAGADASDVYASPVNSDQPCTQTRSASSESRDAAAASSGAKPRHVILRRKNKNPMEEGRRRRSLTAQGNRGVRPEHDTYKIQNNWMRRDVTDPPRSAQTRRSSLHSSIPVIVLTSDVNEVTYLSVNRRASHDAYC